MYFSGCQHVVRAETEEDLFKKAAEHAKQHGPGSDAGMLEQIRAVIREG